MSDRGTDPELGDRAPAKIKTNPSLASQGRSGHGHGHGHSPHTSKHMIAASVRRMSQAFASSVMLRRGSTAFGLTPALLSRVADEHDDGKTLQSLGGVGAVALALGSDTEGGIKINPNHDLDTELANRRRVFGENKVPEPPRKTYLQLLLEALKDTTLIILCVAAAVSLALSFVHIKSDSPCDDFDPHNAPAEEEKKSSHEFLESLAILAAVVVVSNVTALNDFSKEKQFRKLNEASRNTDIIQVVRNGRREDIQTQHLVVGDVLLLTAGDKVPSDGVVIDGEAFSCDESALTGEPDLIKKKTDGYMKAGALVSEGFGKMLVTAVGVHTDSGKAQMLLRAEAPEPTPLQLKLDTMAADIGKLGMFMAVFTFLSVVIRFVVCRTDVDEKWDFGELKVLLNFLILGITIVVVAVPEGLPLAVTISLAYSMRKMMKDQNLVRKLAACETMGGATNICSDKTGTLTENRMTVTEAVVFGNVMAPITPAAAAQGELLAVLKEALAVNSLEASFVQKSEHGQWDFKGNKTECALLVMCNNLGADFHEIREKCHVEGRKLRSIPFTSDRKRMTTVCVVPGGGKSHPVDGKPVFSGQVTARIHTKGAAEIVLGLCSKMVDSNGDVVPLNESSIRECKSHMSRLTKSGLRTLCVAYRETVLQAGDVAKMEEDALETDLTLLCIAGIKDPVRAAVPDAVAQCKKAGITVRMVTGDNIDTAKHIARECGILDDDGIAMEGKDFRVLSSEEMEKILPKLQVLARSKPVDKHTLVKKLKDMGEVVAVTGDGTNDAPALKEADVGLAMGITGTDVAKKASDIVILDDNFASIVRAVMWGRNVYDSIRKFLQFQLTVNVAALFVAYIGAVVNSRSPLTPVQLMWVNLIMDTLAALALATELPTPELLDRKPHGRFDSLISNRMWTNVTGQAVLQMIILLVMLFKGEDWYCGGDDVSSTRKEETNYTMVFNAFVFLQLFNEVNARELGTKLNVFKGMFRNSLFVGVMVITVALQSIIVEFGGDFFQVRPLNAWRFFLGMGIGALSWPWAVVLKQFEIPFDTFFRRARRAEEKVRLQPGDVEMQTPVS